MSDLAVSIGIGAVLKGSFEYAVATAPKKLARIGDAIKLLNRPGFRGGSN